MKKQDRNHFAELIRYLTMQHDLTSLVSGDGIVADTSDSDAIKNFYISRRINNCRSATLRCYANRLAYLVQYGKRIKKPLTLMTEQDIQGYLYSIIDNGLSPETINGRLRVFKIFYNFLYDQELIRQNPTARIKYLKIDHKAKPTISVQQMDLFIKSLNGRDFHTVRNKNIILVLYDSMLRVKELCRINLDDVHFDSGTIDINESKSRRSRVVPISFKTAGQLHRYIMKYRQGKPGNSLFCHEDGAPLSTERVYKMIRRKSSLVGQRIYPHLIRHTGATQFIRNGGSVALLQRILGHADIRTTQVYLHNQIDDVKANHDRFSPVNSLYLER